MNIRVRVPVNRGTENVLCQTSRRESAANITTRQQRGCSNMTLTQKRNTAMKRHTLIGTLALSFSMITLAGCSADAAGGAGCATTSECGGSAVCLVVGGAGTCAPTCSASASSCSGTAECSGVGVTSIDVCQQPQDPSMPGSPVDQPKVVCTTDAECNALQAGTICASFRGVRDCTIPCTVETQCDVPSVGGVSIDFYACGQDEAQTTRQACLPDPACIDAPASCVRVAGI